MVRFFNDHGVGGVAPPTELDNNSNSVAVDLVAPPQTELKRKDFPLIKYWYRREWPFRKGNFVQTEDGNYVSASQFDDIRKYARILWEIFLVEGVAPPKWTLAAPHTRRQYHQSMGAAFPEIKLCQNNWKADHFATLYYPGWYKYKVTSKRRQSIDPSVSRISLFHRYIL